MFVYLNLFSRNCSKVFIIFGLVILPLLSSAETPSDKDSSEKKGFDSRMYIGAGIGQSLMSPKTAGTIYSVDDDKDFSYRIYFGKDLSESLSLEMALANLGTTTLKPTGMIDYSVTSLNILYYFYEQGENDHEGWGSYIKAGLATLDTSATVPYIQNNSAQLTFGIGAEYGWKNGFAARIDLESYDEDAALLTVGLLYRFGKKDKKPMRKDSDSDGVFDDNDQCPATPITKKVDAEGCELVSDKDGDGAPDEIDQCPNTIKGANVNNVGCAIFETKIEGINFKVNSADLTEDSKLILNNVVDALLKFNTVRIEIQAHTDSQGKETYNLNLSQSRAKSVVIYLKSKGIVEDRMEFKGYGETQPFFDNNTKEGRAKNRRVEFRVLDSGLSAE